MDGHVAKQSDDTEHSPYGWPQAENNYEIFPNEWKHFQSPTRFRTIYGNGGSAYAIPPNPPASTITGEPIFVQSYINAYNTAFNQETSSYHLNYQVALNNYNLFTPSDINSNFIPGTFGYYEGYTGSIGNSQSNIIIRRLQDDLNVYSGTPYLFVSAGSGGGSGFMYLDWIIVTYGVPYIINVG